MRKFGLSCFALLLLIGLCSSAFAQPYGYGTLPRNPCDSAYVPVNSVPISSSAQTLQLVAAPTAPAVFGGGTAQIFVCGYQFTATGTFSFVSGTGTNCGTGQSSLTGTMVTQVSPAANSAPQFEGAVLVAPAGQALCITSAAAATGFLWYAVQ